MSVELNVGSDWEQSKALVVLWHNKWASQQAELERFQISSWDQLNNENEKLKAKLAIAINVLEPLDHNELVKCPHCKDLYMAHYDFCPIEEALEKLKGEK